VKVARMTIGVGVGAQHLCAVGVMSDRIELAVQLEREPGRSLADELEEMLRRAAVPRWTRATVVASIGPFACQTKLVCDLPILEQVDALTSVVREGAGRFFMRNGVSLITSSVLPTVAGSGWASAYEEPVISQVQRACESVRLPLRMAAPTALALTRATSVESIEWHDGDVALRIESRDGALRHVSRTVASCDSSATPKPVEALAKLGEGAWIYADAYGVTQLARNEPLALRFDSGHLGRSARSHRGRVAVIAAALSFAAAVIAPAISSSLAQRSAERHLRAVASPVRDVLRNQRELEQITSALADAAAFSHSRRPVIILLGSLSRSLPDSSVLVTLRIDSIGGTAVLLTNRTAEALRAFDNVAGVYAPEIVGPVTKEVNAGRELERATIRFRFIDATGGR
jgi:hypothetical protein